MNALIDTYLSAKGLDNAMEIAKILLHNDYQVMIQLDDCDVYIIAFESNDPSLGDNSFASLTQEEIEREEREELRKRAEKREEYINWYRNQRIYDDIY